METKNGKPQDIENKPTDSTTSSATASYKIYEIDAQTMQTRDLTESNDAAKIYKAFKSLKVNELCVLVLEINGIQTAFRACKSLPVNSLEMLAECLAGENHAVLTERNDGSPLESTAYGFCWQMARPEPSEKHTVSVSKQCTKRTKTGQSAKRASATV